MKASPLRLPTLRRGMTLEIPVEILEVRFARHGRVHEVRLAKPINTTQRRALRRNGWTYRARWRGWVK